MKIDISRGWLRTTLCGLGLAAALSTTGCQSLIGGQILPSGFYQEDDVQYFAPGPEMPLTREAAAIKQYEAEEALRGR